MLIYPNCIGLLFQCWQLNNLQEYFLVTQCFGLAKSVLMCMYKSVLFADFGELCQSCEEYCGGVFGSKAELRGGGCQVLFL